MTKSACYSNQRLFKLHFKTRGNGEASSIFTYSQLRVTVLFCTQKPCVLESVKTFPPLVCGAAVLHFADPKLCCYQLSGSMTDGVV